MPLFRRTRHGPALPALRRAVDDPDAYAELAEESGVSAQAVRARVSRGLRSLAARLDQPVGETA